MHERAKLTSQTNSWSAIERQVSPFCICLVVVEWHVLVPALRSEQLGTHAIEIKTSIHSVNAVSYCSAFRDEDKRLSVRPTTSGEDSCPQGRASVNR